MQKWIIMIIVIIIAVLGIFIVFNMDIETEYVPESEIEETELRKTIITLYFVDKSTGELSKETRMIDSKELLKNPYKTLIDLLINGPENTNYIGIFPINTKLLDVKFENGIVIMNFSKEFSENIEVGNLEVRKKAIYQTLTQLTEVYEIKILVEGVEIEN